MKPERWRKIETLCQKAMNLQGTERTVYLEHVCAGDKELLEEVTSLLDYEDSEWLQQPLVQVQSSFVFSDDQSVSDQTIGPYRIINTIASGGMGKVYLGVRNDDQFERFVALKVIRKGLVSDNVLKRFYEERQILASLNHPNIARLFDGGTTEDGLPWFAMEYIEGLPITEYCKVHEKNVGEKINLFLSVCSAVQYAHQNLVIHRDLKPENILITPDGTPKLLDFGIAKLMDLEQKSGQTQYQDRIMTPDYASPEQVRNESISTVSDVYALGILLYELLTGALPYQFKKRTPAEIERTICNTIPKRPSAVSDLKIFKGDLDSVIMKALRKEPSERYASVEQLANDLRRYQKALPVLAQKASFTYRARKFLTRHKWGVAVSTAVALLVISFSILTYIQSQAIETRAIEAEQQRDRAEQVSNFLAGLFESADPSRAENESLTAIELLHRGANRVETELTDQPHVQANLFLVISDVYESLGLYDEGLNLAQSAHSLQKKLYEGNHAEIARSLNSMGWLYRQKGEFEKSDSLLTTALVMRQELFGQQHLDVARSLNDLAVLKQSRGDYAATDTLLQEAIEIRKALAGKQHESVAVASSNYAALKWRMGDLSAAEDRMREALDIFQATVGESDMRTAVAMSNLAAIILTRKKTDGVEELYRNALNIRLRLLGEEHPDVAGSYEHLGNFLRAKRKYEEAETLLLKAHDLRKELLGEEHILVGTSKTGLGFLYKQTENYTEAENYYSGAIKIFQRVYPDGHARTAQAWHHLGEIFLEMNKPIQAEPQFRKAMELRERFFGDKDIRTADSMIYLGVCLAKGDNFSESKTLLTKGLEVLNKSGNNSEALRNLAKNTLADL